MNDEIELGYVNDLRLSVGRSAIISTVVLWLTLAFGLRRFTRLSWARSFLFASWAIDLHWISDFVHQMGHAVAARRTGFPMSGIHFWFLIGRSDYPADEPELPGSIHRQRASGGVPASLLLGLLGLLFWRWRRPRSTGGRFLLGWFTLENIVFGIGALVPLNKLFKVGFDTDGDTLLKWRGK